jgi:2-furoyl-CoA dehydrogenase FAD binding subunit
VKPPRFDYVRPENIEEAVEVLAGTGADARVLAGGQSLMAMLNMRLARPQVLVDIMHVPVMDQIRTEAGTAVIPAATRQAELAAWSGLARQLPLVAQMIPWIGHAQTRSRGTVCGSVAHADPSAELPLAMVALDGQIVLRSKKRKRVVAARDFFIGTMLTACLDDELIQEVRIPVSKSGTGTAFREVGRRKGDFAMVACAAIVHGQGVRLAVGGVNDVPAMRDWNRLSDSDVSDALNDFAWSLEARSDLHATARYRRDLVRNLGRQAIGEARQCAG